MENEKIKILKQERKDAYHFFRKVYGTSPFQFSYTSKILADMDKEIKRLTKINR